MTAPPTRPDAARPTTDAGLAALLAACYMALDDLIDNMWITPTPDSKRAIEQARRLLPPGFRNSLIKERFNVA